MPEPSLPYVTSTAALTTQLSAYLKSQGVVAPQVVKLLPAFVQDRLKAQRETLATLVENLAGLYDSLDQNQMDTLAHLIRNHYISDRGDLLPEGDDV